MNRSAFSFCLVLISTCIVAFSGCKSANETAIQEGKSQTLATEPEQALAKPSEKPANTPAPETNPVVAGPTIEPDFITVQHILVGFAGSVPDKPITRTKAEAESFAKEILAMAQAKDADFDALVKEYTDDSHPGIYKMANNNVATNSIPGDAFPRRKMVPAFGDVGFPLQVGQVGIANFDAKSSPFGWHIIKRIK